MASPVLAALRRAAAEDPKPSLRPGWGFAANLTPPELVSSYRVRRLRERILLAVGVVALLVALGFAYGFWQTRQATSQLAAENARTATLNAQARQYMSVTQIQGNIDQVRSKLAGLLGNDVDVATLMGSIQAARPSGVAVSALTVTVGSGSNGSTAGTSGAGAPTAGSLDTSGAAHIGTIEIDGTGLRIDDVPAFVDALSKIPGVVDVLPTSNATQTSGTKFSITLDLTDKLLTHRFAVTTQNGAN